MLLALEIHPGFWGESNSVMLSFSKTSKVEQERNLCSGWKEDMSKDGMVPVEKCFLSQCLWMQSQLNAIGDTCSEQGGQILLIVQSIALEIINNNGNNNPIIKL